MATLQFIGAARTVTGSKYLVESDGHRVLLDCGLFQGLKSLRELNWDGMPVAADTIDAVVLTHAHLDHTGYLPRLVAHGFRGRVFCTPGTADLTKLVLPDSARLHEEDARQANKHQYTKHRPALPLYTEADAYRALTQLQPVGYHRPMPVAPGFEAEFVPAGHLLGSAYVRLTVKAIGRTILFGGDLGRYGRPVLPDPEPAPEADWALCESTYGDRVHAPDDRGEAFAQVIRDTVARGGKLIVPAFAMGRVEELLYWIHRFEQEKRIPVLPVYVDSPMAAEALADYGRRINELDPEIRNGQRQVSAFATARFHTVVSPLDSKQVTASREPAIVISASGMATGGRVLHHLKAALPDPKNTILFVGYQAAGTRGRDLVDGRTEVKIHGLFVPARAHIVKIDSMSAHADRDELLRWLATFPRAPKTLFLVHGEPTPMDTLRRDIEQRFGWTVHCPERLETVALEP